jgi:signal transduction histidine kinase
MLMHERVAWRAQDGGVLNARRLAVLVWVGCVAMAVPTAVLLVLEPGGILPRLSSDIFSGIAGVAALLLALAFASVGAVVARRVADNLIGWIFLAAGFFSSVSLLSWQYVDIDLHTRHHLPGAATAAVINGLMSEQSAGWLGLCLLLFPDGRLPSRRWWPSLAVLLVGMGLFMTAGALRPGAYNEPFAALSNPIGLPGAREALTAADLVGWALVLAGIAAGPAALVVRLRRARGVARQQLKLVLAVGAAATAVGALTMMSWGFWRQIGLPARMVVVQLAFASFAVAAGFAIAKRGLYGIDLAINRTLVYGSVTALLASAFGGTVLLLGTAVGRGSGWATAGATLVVAVTFRPLRARMQDAVDRRFNRARYDALRRMGDFLEELRAGRVAPEDVEGLLRELLSDPALELLFFLPESELYVDVRGASARAVEDDERRRVPIERGGEPLGLVLHGQGVDQRLLLPQLVEAGGLAIEIARLRVGLRRQLAEVEASRARIVTAADAERRRIERDLHDGAQQRLVTIGLALRHAQHELGSSPERARATLDAAVDEVTVAVDELRELARGLPPPQLDRGLAPALRELARRAPVRVTVAAPRERFHKDLEAAAYFIGCEGLTNAVKHAQAKAIVLSAERRNGHLVVCVSDDGVGGASPGRGSGLTGLSDRVAALGGTLHIESAAGVGTTLTAELPCAL